MGIFGRLASAINAGTERTKFGGIEGVLKLRLKSLPLDSPRVQEMISDATACAWRIRIVSGFFKSLGFSYQDYDTMYRALVISFPNRFFGSKMIATSIMVDRCDELLPAFRAIAEAASTTAQGEDRQPTLASLIVEFVGSSLPKATTTP